MSIEHGIVGHVQRAHSTVAKTALNEISTNGIASPKHVEEPAADLLREAFNDWDLSPVCRGACRGVTILRSGAVQHLNGTIFQPRTFQNERTRVVERAFRSSLPLARSGTPIRHAFTANVAHGASGSNGRTYRVSGWQDDTRDPPEHLVGRRLPPIARRLGARRDQDVELTNNLLDEFLKSDSLPAARRVLTDLGLTPVSSACGVFGLWEPNPKRAAQLDAFKKRCEQFASLGLTRIYSPTPTTEKFTRGRLQARCREHARERRHRQAVRDGRDGRGRAHIDLHRHAADDAEDDAGGRASQRGTAARLLSLLVRLE